MNIHNFFDNPDDALIDRIAEEYPILDTDEKERLYAMSKNKYNSEKKENKNDYSEVMGVERYHKPLWHKVLSAVAAAVVVVGGVGGGVLLLGKGGGVDPMTDIEATQPADEEAKEAKETEPAQAEYDYNAIATQLTNDFIDMRSVIELCDVSYDENDFITYNCYSVVNPEDLAEKYGVDLSGKEQRVDFLHTRKLYKVTDARFNSCQNIYDALRKLTSASLLPEENYENVVLPWDSMVTTPIALLGTDVSMYESGSDIYDSYFADFENRTFDTSDSDNWEAALSAFGSLYVEYNGNLYVVGDMNYSYIPVDDVAVRTVDRDRFTATRHFVLSPDREGYETECYKFEFVLENGEWKIDNVYVSDEEFDEIEEIESEDNHDYTAIAQQLFDDYLEGERIVCYGDVSYDENDSITFYTYTSNDAEWSANYGGERTFYKVTDERFNNGQDIYEMMKTITTTNNALRFDNNTSLIGRLVSDVSMFEIGSDVDLNDVDAERQVAAYGINLGVYIEYNGKLYVRPRPYEIEYTTEVKVIETSENGFTASRYMKMPHHNANIQYGEEVILEIVQENGEWKINYMESGIDVEYNASIAIQVYFEDDPDFYDLSIDPGDIIENMEVLEYDDETKRCRVHTIMIDVNGEEAVDFTGEIVLTKQTDEAIADAQVTRLNEYDGTLKRPSVLWAEQQGTLEN